ncbi:hypothetical protein ACSQ67_011477 [Phaseolus vulgaris]
MKSQGRSNGVGSWSGGVSFDEGTLGCACLYARLGYAKCDASLVSILQVRSRTRFGFGCEESWWARSPFRDWRDSKSKVLCLSCSVFGKANNPADYSKTLYLSGCHYA